MNTLYSGAMTEEKRMDRVRTGIEGLDSLLYGGLLRGDAMLVAGAPGTGKTSLGMQFLYNGATKFGEPGLFITFEEFPQRIYRDALSFGWDFPALEEEGKLKVLFTSPEVLQQDIIRDQGMVGEMIAEIGARRVVVDSISHLQEMGQDSRHYREAVYGLVNALKRDNLTAFLTRELREQEEMGTGPEEFVADGVIVMSRAYVGDTNMRFLEVMKSRGSAQIPIPSLYTFTEHGIVVVPPFNDPIYRYEEAVSTGIAQLDRLLGGGIPYGGFYVLEVNADINQSVFDVGFVKEALEAGDYLLRVAGMADARSGWRALIKAAGLEESLRAAEERGQASLLWCGADAGGNGGVDSGGFDVLLERACEQAGGALLRVQVDISRLFALLPPGEGYRHLAAMAARCRGKRAVVLGTVTPSAVHEDDLDRIRTFADGLVRVWTQGNYSYLQVVKTANSARTPVFPVKQVNDPPFLQIMEY
jgi:circadian clock protein KaiC